LIHWSSVDRCQHFRGTSWLQLKIQHILVRLQCHIQNDCNLNFDYSVIYESLELENQPYILESMHITQNQNVEHEHSTRRKQNNIYPNQPAGSHPTYPAEERMKHLYTSLSPIHKDFLLTCKLHLHKRLPNIDNRRVLHHQCFAHIIHSTNYVE
jgi:hypothetical protein